MTKAIVLTIEPVPWLNMMITLEDDTGARRTFVMGTPFNNEEKLLRIGKSELRIDGEKDPDKPASLSNVQPIDKVAVRKLLQQYKDEGAQVLYGTYEPEGNLAGKKTDDWEVIEAVPKVETNVSKAKRAKKAAKQH